MVAGVDNLPRVPLFFGIERYEGKPAIVAEIKFMVEGGLSPMQALQTATINPAQLSRVDDRLGTVEQGKLADLIVVEGDPLTNLDALHDLRLIMKGGKIIRSSLGGQPAPGFSARRAVRGPDRAHRRHDGDGLAPPPVTGSSHHE